MTSFDMARLMRPRSIAIVGISPEPTSPGFTLLRNLEHFGYGGAIHLVSRSRNEVKGRPCVPEIDALPHGIDCAVLMLPRAATEEAVSALARRRAGAAVVFAAGFGEASGEWEAAQQRFAAVARDAGMALAGPNCLGLTNYVDGISLTFSPGQVKDQPGRAQIAVVAQSGGLASILRIAFAARGLGVTYTVSTGNEAVVTLEDYIDFILDDAETRIIVAFAEEIRDPRRFLALTRRARGAGKPIVLFHTGKSAAARDSARSHTGALAGDYATISCLVRHHGAVEVQSLEELIDVTELLVRFPAPPARGLACITDSGAFKGIALDLADALGLEMPPPVPECAARIAKELPDFVGPSNPLDITAQAIIQPDLYARTMTPLMEDPAYDALMLAIIVRGNTEAALEKARAVWRPAAAIGKPTVFALLGDEAEVPTALPDEVRAAGIPFFRSPERAMRALACVARYGREGARATVDVAALDAPPLPHGGIIPEHASKAYLAALGVPVPKGGLVRDLGAAETLAAELGFPVAMKLQTAALPHKSDVGGIVLGVGERGVAAAWRRLETLARDLKLRPDGVLVEAMAPKGIEAIVGARRDRRWGPVLAVGLGGIWTEIFADVRVLPPDLAAGDIADELLRLKGARLFAGVRGAPPADRMAVARIATLMGALMRARPEIREIDLNPVNVTAEGALALDALIVANGD